MTETKDTEYYWRREAIERQLAEDSGDPLVARIHLDMAQRYAELAVAAVDRPVLRIIT